MAVLMPDLALMAILPSYMPESIMTSTFWTPKESMVRKQAQTLDGLLGFSYRNLARFVRWPSAVSIRPTLSVLMYGSKTALALATSSGVRLRYAALISSIFLAASRSLMASNLVTLAKSSAESCPRAIRFSSFCDSLSSPPPPPPPENRLSSLGLVEKSNVSHDSAPSVASDGSADTLSSLRGWLTVFFVFFFFWVLPPPGGADDDEEEPKRRVAA
mmetsp:Transcript_24741/g.57973  ORF Transcript_24741/g.57973 Transcript_24741/m.57973 type:complete len:216 (-) Transcript_24741:95-742(-)